MVVAEGAEDGLHVIALCSVIGGAGWDCLFRNATAIFWCKYGLPAGTRTQVAAPIGSTRVPLWIYGPKGLCYVELDTLHAARSPSVSQQTGRASCMERVCQYDEISVC